MNKIARIAASIPLKRIDTCAACGKRTTGTLKRIDAHCTSTAELKDLIDNSPLTSHDMPYG